MTTIKGSRSDDSIVIPELEAFIEEKKKRTITPEISKAIEKYWQDIPRSVLVEKINDHFGTELSDGQIRHHYYSKIKNKA